MKMMGYSLVLLTIIITYLAYSLGVQLPYKHKTILEFGPGENITITCSGDDEVVWDVVTTPGGAYSIREETPNRKILEVRNATLYSTAICRCHSKINENDSILVTLNPDYDKFGFGLIMSHTHDH